MEIDRNASKSLIWLANNINRVQRMCTRVNSDYSDELWSLCVDAIDEIYNRYDPLFGIPIDRYLLSILRKRCVAWCVKRHRLNGYVNGVQQYPFDLQAQNKSLTTTEDRELLLILIGRLDPPLTLSETDILWMYTVEGRTFTEIGSKLKTSESSIRREYWQIFWRLRKLAVNK